MTAFISATFAKTRFTTSIHCSSFEAKAESMYTNQELKNGSKAITEHTKKVYETDTRSKNGSKKLQTFL